MSDELDDILGEHEELVVNVYDYLRESGFSSQVSTEITLAALIRSAFMTREEIQVAANEMGYALPSEVDASGFTPFKYRN